MNAGDLPAALRPDFERALAAHRGGRLDEAEKIYRNLLRTAPAFLPAAAMLGAVALQTGRPGLAAELLGKAVAGGLDDAETLYNLSFAHKAEGRLGDAATALRRAVAKAPGFVEAWSNLAAIYVGLRRFEDALAAIRRATAIRPDSAVVLSNLGSVLRDVGANDEAIDALQRAIAIAPDHADAHYNLALCLLTAGRLAEAWPHYAWRWKARTTRRPFAQPAWDGRPLAGGKLLVWGEQGVGEEILYASVLPELVADGIRIVLECDPRFVPLFGRSFPDVEAVARRDPPDPRLAVPDIVAQAPSGDLLRWRRADSFAIPRRESYLRADRDLAERLRRRYRERGGRLLVGVSWGSRNPKIGDSKSVPLAGWGPIFAVPDLTFVSVQYGAGAEDATFVRRTFGVDLAIDPEVDPLADLDAAAAQIAALDLVVTVSNTAVHLAGALGTPVWTMLPEGRGIVWYWFLDRADSPWYPSLRFFRQETFGDWTPVVARVAAELAGYTASRGA